MYYSLRSKDDASSFENGCDMYYSLRSKDVRAGLPISKWESVFLQTGLSGALETLCGQAYAVF
jgi:hypothetical protein